MSKKRTVILTRNEFDNTKLEDRYPEIRWINFPLIEFKYQKIEPKDLTALHSNVDWLIFTSQNGVKSFFDQTKPAKTIKIASVGPKTKSLIESFGYPVDFVPEAYDSKTLAKEIPFRPGDKAVYVGGNLASEETVQILNQRAGSLLQLEVYKTTKVKHKKTAWLQMFEQDPSVIAFCSPSAVQSYAQQVQELQIQKSNEIQFAAIGKTTEKSIKDDIGEQAITPEMNTFDAMIKKIIEILKA